MKRKKLSVALLGLSLIGALVGCGGNKTSNESSTNTPSVNVSSTSESKTSTQASTSSVVNNNVSSSEVKVSSSAVSENTVSTYINKALNKLDELVLPSIQKITDTSLKASVQSYYDEEKTTISRITELEAAKAALDKVINDTKAFVGSTLKNTAIDRLNAVINPLIVKITHEELKASVQSFYNNEITKMSTVDSIAGLTDTYLEIVDDTKEFIKTETGKVVIALKNKALQELDPYVNALISKIPYETLKNDTRTFYNQEKSKLDSVDTIEGVPECVTEIKNDLVNNDLIELKKNVNFKFIDVFKIFIFNINYFNF